MSYLRYLILCLVFSGTACADVLANLLDPEQKLFDGYTNGLDRSGFNYRCALSKKQQAALGIDDPDSNRGVEIFRLSDGVILYYTITELHPLAGDAGGDVFIEVPKVVSRVYYSSPGADAIWFTADDEKEGAINIPDYANIDLDGFATGGNDGEFFTSDDYLPEGYERYVINSDGRLIEEHKYDTDGDDGDWYTDDDEYVQRTFRDYFANGLLQGYRSQIPNQIIHS